MKKVPSSIVKKRSRELTSVFEAFTPYNGMQGRVERIWISDIAADGIHLVRPNTNLCVLFENWLMKETFAQISFCSFTANIFTSSVDH